MIEPKDRAPLRAYFPHTADTLVSACLDGRLGRAAQGDGWAALLAGDFAFLAGRPEREALAWLDAAKADYLILSAPEDWLRLTEDYPRPFRRSARYAFDSSPSVDAPALRALCRAVPEGARVLPMAEEWFRQCRALPELRDLCSAFPDMRAFAAHGVGRVAVIENRVVAGASTYAWDAASIEIEIDTLPAFRRRGLATACGAALVLACAEKGVRPHWDAANETSMRLAMRLGFGAPRPYAVIEWSQK